MKAHLILVHGMRRGTLNEKLHSFVEELMSSSNLNYRVAFLESDTKNPYVVIDKMIQNGATEIVIVPLLIFSASHMLEDVPEIVEHYNKNGISISVTPPLGTHKLMLDIIEKRLKNRLPDSQIIVIAHGNKRFEEADNELTTLLYSLKEDAYPMMIYGKLSYEKLLPKLAKDGKPVTIVPLFLYDGYLVGKIKKTLSEMALPVEYKVTKSINFDPLLRDIIEDHARGL